ncbi:MAG: AAA family ATPase [Chloroflexota bacterium]
MHLKKVLFHPDEYPTGEDYPFNLDIFRHAESIAFHSPVTFFIGENGTGKSTLLKALCLRCGVHIWQETERRRFKYNPYEDDLYKYIDVQWTDGAVPGSFFASQIFNDFARFLDEVAFATPGILAYYGGDSLVTQSHGQSLISYFTARYRVKGIYFMDEPETALSPKSQLKLLKVLKNMGQEGHAQFIIATHSPILLACPGAVIYSFDDIPVKQVGYEETEYYQLYKDFMNNREDYLERL